MDTTQKGNKMDTTQKETMDLSSLVENTAIELSMKKSDINIQDTTVDNSLDGTIKDIVYQPLDYTGAKDELIPQIVRFLPQEVNTFIDLSGGSSSIGININANKIIYNEKDTNIFNVIKGMSQGIPDVNLRKILKLEGEYDLGKSKREYKNKHNKLLEDYKKSSIKSWEDFYIWSIYSWDERLNDSIEDIDNSPTVSYTHCFDYNLQNKFMKYSEKLISMGNKVEYSNLSYEDYKDRDYQDDDLAYIDLSSSSTGTDYLQTWSEENGDEKLFEFIDQLDAKGVKFAMSNIFEIDGKTNEPLKKWAEKYKVYSLDSTDKSKIIDPETEEQAYSTVKVLITNYGEGCNNPDVAKMYKHDVNIVQGGFFIDDEVEQGNESHRLAELAHDKFKASFREALVHKCEELVQRVNTGKSILLFKEKHAIQKRLDKKKGVKTQSYKQAIKSAYNFDYETGRACMYLANDPRIAKLTVDDIMKFERKSLDALKDMTYLTDEEFSLFLNGKHILKKRRPIAPSRKKPSTEDSEKEFINPFPDLALDSEVKELLAMDQVEVVELYLRYKFTSKASLQSSANNSFVDYIDVEVQNTSLAKVA